MYCMVSVVELDDLSNYGSVFIDWFHSSHMKFSYQHSFLLPVRFAAYRGGGSSGAAGSGAQLSLRPLFFEVPQTDPDQLFVGRSWLWRQLEQHLVDQDHRGVVLTGEAPDGEVYASKKNSVIYILQVNLHLNSIIFYLD